MKKGIVSDIDYKNGMVYVIYTDGEGGVTDLASCLSAGDEYKMPALGDIVITDSTSSGHIIVLGKLWNKGNVPEKSGKGIYHKKLSDGVCIAASGQGDMEITAKDININTNNAKITASNIEFNTEYGQVTVTEIMKRLEKLEGG